jgi:hypothetical protein
VPKALPAVVPGIMHKLLDDFPLGRRGCGRHPREPRPRERGLHANAGAKADRAKVRRRMGMCSEDRPPSPRLRRLLRPQRSLRVFAQGELRLAASGAEGLGEETIAAIVEADELDAKVKAFERAYERAGVKHYDSRKRWAAMRRQASSLSASAISISAEQGTAQRHGLCLYAGSASIL